MHGRPIDTHSTSLLIELDSLADAARRSCCDDEPSASHHHPLIAAMAAVADGGGDHDGSSSDGGLPTSPRQPCWLAGAPAAAADGRAAAVVEVLCVLAQSYLMCFGLWAGLLAFMQSMFWHILGGLSVDYFAFAVLFSLTVLCPIILEARPVLRLYGRHEWVMMGVVPAAAALLALIPSQSVRTLFTGIWAAAAFAGLAGCLAGPASSALARRAPASLVIGCVMLQAMRLGWSGATPIVDSGFVGWYIAGCILAMLSAILLFMQRCGDGTPQAAEAAEQPYVCCERGHACWIWLFVGPVLGGAVSLTIAYFNHAGALPKYVGCKPFPACLVVILSITCGWLILALPRPAWSISSDVKSTESGFSRLKYLTGAADKVLWSVTAIGLLIGDVLLFEFHWILGAAILGMMFPAMVKAAHVWYTFGSYLDCRLLLGCVAD
jgi:hypothetical protein